VVTKLIIARMALIHYTSSRKVNWIARCQVLSDPLVAIDLRQYRLLAVSLVLG